MKKLLVFCVAFITAASCSDKSNNEINEQNAKNVISSQSFNIASIETANSSELDIVGGFLNNKSLITRFSINQDVLNFNMPEVVTYTNLKGKSIVIDCSNKKQNSNSEQSIILVVNDNNDIIANYEHEKINNGETFIVKTFVNGEEWFTAEVEKTTEKIIKFNFASEGGIKRTMGFMECAEMAVSACVSDGMCGFICGIVWKYCLGSVALACAIHAL